MSLKRKHLEIARKALIAARSSLHESTKVLEGDDRAVSSLRIDQVSKIIHDVTRDLAWIRKGEK